MLRLLTVVIGLVLIWTIAGIVATFIDVSQDRIFMFIAAAELIGHETNEKRHKKDGGEK